MPSTTWDRRAEATPSVWHQGIGTAHPWIADDPDLRAGRVACDLMPPWPHLTGPQARS
ncbi:hypothetical protein [Streptomyces sp. NPDC059979]|uniref:hypothetical protein n=1 Tax=unclassified Streptomyces TaxID=2593676 RepID=UPI00365F28DC